MNTLGWNFRKVGKAVLAFGLLLSVMGGAHAADGNYLIVSANSFAGGAAITQLAAAKTAQGFDVTVYSVPTGTSRDTIRNYIRGWYTEPLAANYVLIVGLGTGSTATSTRIPYWNGVGGSGGDTDLYYACLDSGDDWYPDLSIGRFPVSSEAECQALVSKTLAVESGLFPDPEYVKRCTFLATSDTGAGAEEAHEWVIENCVEPHLYLPNRIYANSGGGTADVSAAVNAGTMHLVYFGHSGSSGWWTPSFDTGDVQALNNAGLYGVVLAFSCHTVEMGGGAVGDRWVCSANKGSAVYIGATTFIYWTQSPWHESQNLEKFFYDAIFNKGADRAGDGWRGALFSMIDEYGPTTAMRDHFEMFTFLGDPGLKLPRYEVGPIPTAGVRAPNGGEVLVSGVEYEIEWFAYDDVGVSSVDIYLSTDSGATFPEQIAGGLANTGIFTWQAPHLESTTCRVKVVAHDDDSNYGEDVSDADFTITPYGPTPVHQFPLNENPGWSTSGLWAWGQPSGQGGSHGYSDPNSGHSGFNVYGYNLAGDYESSMPERHLTSVALDCSDVSGTSLVFWRWLGVETPSYDHAYVRVSNDGSNWFTVWQNTSEIAESSWSLQEIDISTVADNQSTVYLRWTMGTSDSMWEFCGWNIDDIEVWGTVPHHLVPGDLDCSGAVDFDDIDPFVLALSGEEAYYAAYPDCDWMNADCDADGDVDFDDIDAFVALLGG